MKISKTSLTKWILLLVSCCSQTVKPEMVLDETFGVGGMATIPEEARYGNIPLIQPDGKILITTENGLFCFNQNGSLDTAFNNHTTPAPHNIVSLTIHHNDIVLTEINHVSNELTLRRYNSNGAFQGELTVILSPLHYLRNITFQSDGKFIISGKQQYQLGRQVFSLLIRYNADGTVDETFNHPVREACTITSIAVQSNGKIIAAMGSKLLVCYNPDGSLDREFEANRLPFYTEDARSILLQPDHKVIVVYPHFIIRYDAAGTLDTTFVPSQTNTPFSPENIVSITLKPDGKIIVLSHDNHYIHNLLSCYTKNGLPDATFGAQGAHTLSLPQNGYSSVVFDSSTETIIVAGRYKYHPDRISQSVLLRYRNLTPIEIEERRLAALAEEAGLFAREEVTRLANEAYDFMHIGSEREQCSICLEEIREIPLETVCHHLFHPTCMNTWRTTGGDGANTCPACRGNLNAQQ